MLRCFTPGIHGWGRLSEKWGFDFNGTALICNDGLVYLIDPVECSDAELGAIQALGSRFEIILLNADHERASAELAESLDAPIWIHRADQAALRNPKTTAFDDGHVFDGGWRAVQLHALKTPGESVLVNVSARTVIIGDALIGDPVTGLRFVPPMKLPDHSAALASVSRLLDFDFDNI